LNFFVNNHHSSRLNGRSHLVLLLETIVTIWARVDCKLLLGVMEVYQQIEFQGTAVLMKLGLSQPFLDHETHQKFLNNLS